MIIYEKLIFVHDGNIIKEYKFDVNYMCKRGIIPRVGESIILENGDSYLISNVVWNMKKFRISIMLDKLK